MKHDSTYIVDENDKKSNILQNMDKFSKINNFIIHKDFLKTNQSSVNFITEKSENTENFRFKVKNARSMSSPLKEKEESQHRIFYNYFDILHKKILDSNEKIKITKDFYKNEFKCSIFSSQEKDKKEVFDGIKSVFQVSFLKSIFCFFKKKIQIIRKIKKVIINNLRENFNIEKLIKKNQIIYELERIFFNSEKNENFTIQNYNNLFS